MKYWINTVSAEHIERGIEQGITQANHGSPAGLRRMNRGDRIAFYAPRDRFEGGKPLRQFYALAEVTDDAPYQVEMAPDFHPWRRNVRFLASKPAQAEDLVPELEFIKDKQRWGFPFRRGLFEIGETDCKRIEGAMQASQG